jgi:predicted RNA-binding protein Jag
LKQNIFKGFSPMKSILQEASSVAKAIDKAWHAVGMPEEFTIKVFEIEKKNFFGFVKSPAVVSIIYDPRKVFKGSKERDSKPSQHQQEASTSYHKKEEYSYKQKRAISKDRPSYKQNQSNQYNNQHEETITYYDHQQSSAQDQASWQPEMIMDVNRWLKEMVEILKVESRFEYSTDQNILHIDFNQPVLLEVEYEQMLFASFAHLLLQFLKRKYKNQIRNLRILISSKR